MVKNSKKRGFPGGSVVETSPSYVRAVGSFPDWGAGIPHTSRLGSKGIVQKQCCSKFNKDFKNDLHQKNLKKKKKGTLDLTLDPKDFLLSFFIKLLSFMFCIQICSPF